MTLTRYLTHLPRWGVEVAVALEDGTQSPSRRRRQRLYAVTECADHFCFWHQTDKADRSNDVRCLGVDRKSPANGQTDANDPMLTSATPNSDALDAGSAPYQSSRFSRYDWVS
jgi:hypothetical protein